MIRAYIRVSTEDQNLGPDAQRQAIVRSMAGCDFEFYEDRISGGLPVEDRPELMHLIGDLEPGDVVIAAKRDRFARDVMQMIILERLVKDAGASIRTADGVSDADTPEGQLMRGMIDLFAQYERAVIKARTKSALAVKKARGEYVGGNVGFGRKVEDGKVVTDNMATIVMDQVLQVYDRTKSVRATERELMRLGVLVKGRYLSRTAIQSIIGRSDGGALEAAADLLQPE